MKRYCSVCQIPREGLEQSCVYSELRGLFPFDSSSRVVGLEVRNYFLNEVTFGKQVSEWTVQSHGRTR